MNRADVRPAPKTAVAVAIALAIVGATGWIVWPQGVPRRYLVALLAIGGAAIALAVLGRAGVARTWAATLGRLPFWLRVTLVSSVIIAAGVRLAWWPDVHGVPFLLYVGMACVALAAWCGAVVAVVRRAPPKRATLLTGTAAITMGLVVLAAIAVEVVLAGFASGAAAEVGTPRTFDGAGAASMDGAAPSRVDASTSRFEALRGDDPIDRETFDRALRRHEHVVMPDAWRSRPFDHPGARRAQWWHGVRHMEDVECVRLPNDAAPESAAPVATAGGTATVLVTGDSVAYALGIETRDRLTERLEALLRGAGLPARVLNRGICSHQSEDVLLRFPHELKRFSPDVVVYAICLNDFLPSRVDIYDRSWRLPEWLSGRSRLLQTIDRAIVQAQIALGLSADFHSDILRNLGKCRDRFEHDVSEMARFARERGIPMLAIVVDPLPSPDGSSAAIAAVAEEACRRAGIDVVDTASLEARFAGVPLTVSPWEPHANEIAHAAWARLLFVRIQPLLESKSSSRGAPAPPADLQ